MTYAHTLAGTRYAFDDLRILLARATPFRSGDALAGLAADPAFVGFDRAAASA